MTNQTTTNTININMNVTERQADMIAYSLRQIVWNYDGSDDVRAEFAAVLKQVEAAIKGDRAGRA